MPNKLDMLRGHQIEICDGQWVYADTKEPTSEHYKTRPCGECGLMYTPEGHDGCLGILKDVSNACCGHGRTVEAYVQFDDGVRLSGKKAIHAMQQLRTAPE